MHTEHTLNIMLDFHLEIRNCVVGGAGTGWVGVKNENFKEIEIWKYNAAMAVEYVIRIVRHHITMVLFIYTYEGI